MDSEEQVLDINMFVAPQKQIYNLMKFDSYGRFLKSDLYNVSRQGAPVTTFPLPAGVTTDCSILQACLAADLKGKKLPFTGLDNMEKELFTGLQVLVVDRLGSCLKDYFSEP